MVNLYCVRPKGFNIGNDVIFLAVQHFIRKAFKENVNIISLAATNKYETNKKSGLTPATIYEINQYGHGLVIGGGNLYENGELDVKPSSLTALEVPMMIFSASRGKIFNKNYQLVNRTDVMPDETIKLLNKKADISLARDIATSEYLKSLNCDHKLVGCPTLFLNEIPQHSIQVRGNTTTDVLISVRNPTLMSIPVVDQVKVYEQILKIIDILKSKGYLHIKFLCHDHRDISFASSFKDYEYFYTEDVYEYITLLRNTKLNVSFRLHSFLPCMAFDIPAIKLSYDQRAISMLETIGMDKWNINLIKDDPIKEFSERIDNLENLKIIKKDLYQSVWKSFKDKIDSETKNFARLVHEKLHNQ